MRKTRLIAFALLIITSIMLLTGCVRYKAELEVTKKGTINFSMLYAVSTTLLNEQFSDSTDTVLDEEQIAEYEQNGFDVTEYNEDGYKGVILSKNDIDPIAERKKADPSTAKTIDKQIQFEKNSNGNYEIRIQKDDLFGGKDNATTDMEEDGVSDSMAMETIRQAGGYMELSVKLPCEAVSSNATKTEGQTLTWDLLSFNEDSIYIELGKGFLLSMLLARYLGVLVAVAVLIIILVVGIAVAKSKHNRTYQTEV